MAKAQATSQLPTEKKIEINQYEAMFLLPPGAPTDEDGRGLRFVRSTIERHGGQIVVLKRWDERKLSYEVNGQKRGTYVIAYFRAPGPIVTAIERDVKLSDEVLRVMVTKADHLNEQEMNAVEPQPIVREERPSWERGFEDRPRRDFGDRPRDDRGPRNDDRGPRDERPRDDRPREDRPRDDRPPRARREDGPAAPAAAPAADPTGADKD